MNDSQFSAELKAAKLTARAEEEKTIRRVEFQLVREFTIQAAEWLGPVAVNQRDLMVNGDVEKFTTDIGAYHAVAELSGAVGSSDLKADGIVATATTKAGKGDDDEPTYWLTLTFEAFPSPALLSFLASSLKEFIECDFKRQQLGMEDAG